MCFLSSQISRNPNAECRATIHIGQQEKRERERAASAMIALQPQSAERKCPTRMEERSTEYALSKISIWSTRRKTRCLKGRRRARHIAKIPAANLFAAGTDHQRADHQLLSPRGRATDGLSRLTAAELPRRSSKRTGSVRSRRSAPRPIGPLRPDRSAR